MLVISLVGCAGERRESRMQNESRSAAGAIPRIEPPEAKRRVESGAALLVCAYDSAEKFRKNHLQGALSLDEFHSREPALAKDAEIIFYCA
jgi:hypothetical protein